MIINFDEKDSEVLINAILDRTLSGGSAGGSAQTPPGLSAIMGTLSAIQHQIQTLRDDTMASFQEVLSAVQGNSTLISEAATELVSINSRVAELLSSSPSAAQLTELQGLVSQQGDSLTKIVDTAKQTAPLSVSPVVPTPVPAPVPTPDPTGGTPVVTPPVEPPAPVVPPVAPPATPDPVVVAPAPGGVGLPGGVAIDVPPAVPPVGAPPVGAPATPTPATPTPVVATPVTPAPLF